MRVLFSFPKSLRHVESPLRRSLLHFWEAGEAGFQSVD